MAAVAAAIVVPGATVPRPDHIRTNELNHAVT